VLPAARFLNRSPLRVVRGDNGNKASGGTLAAQCAHR
jgi:hypothetical protein